MKQKIKNILKKLFWPIYRRYRSINDKLDSIVNKLSLIDGIVELKDVRFWVPNAPRDRIQNIQLSKSTFYEFNILQELDKYLTRDSVVVDIGANVGNHTIYWGKISKVKKIYAFEPVKSIFNILVKNVEINNLLGKVKLYNIGLSDKMSKGKIETYNLDILGGTSISEIDDGDLELNKLDNINEINEEQKIDFVKIDVEYFEKYVLLGASTFFTRYTPIVFIESYQGVNQYDFVYSYFKNLNYNEPLKFGRNYLFINPKE